MPAFSGEVFLWVNNSKSVFTHCDIVKCKIELELEAGWISGPLDIPLFPNFRLSPLGLVPKKELNSYRLIHNLSYPEKNSLYYLTDKSDASVSYTAFNDVLILLRKYGQGALLAKSDIKSAFRLLPVNPEGFNFFGFQFLGKYFFYRCLPMGFTLSCFYFEAFTTFLQWVVEQEVVSIVHYLDDFLFIGKMDSA